MGFRSPYYFTIKFADPSLHVRELADPSLHVREYQRLLFLYQILRGVKSKIIVSVSKVRLYFPYNLYLCIGEDSYRGEPRRERNQSGVHIHESPYLETVRAFYLP